MGSLAGIIQERVIEVPKHWESSGMLFPMDKIRSGETLQWLLLAGHQANTLGLQLERWRWRERDRDRERGETLRVFVRLITMVTWYRYPQLGIFYKPL